MTPPLLQHPPPPLTSPQAPIYQGLANRGTGVSGVVGTWSLLPALRLQSIGGGGGVELGTGEQTEHGPDCRLGLGILTAHDFMHWASSYIIND